VEFPFTPIAALQPDTKGVPANPKDAPVTTQLMTQAQFARHRGVSKGCVTNWKTAKLLVLAEGPGGKPMVDVVRTELKLNANLDPGRGRPTTGANATATPGGEAPALPLGEGPAAAPESPKAPDFNDERTQHLREQRIGQAMKNAQLAGQLVPLVEAERRVSEVGRAARERMHAWFRGIAERVAAEKDVRQIMAIGESGIDEVFAELADAAERGDFAGHDDDLPPEEVAEMESAAAE
jgi:hypothetical protein